VRVLPPNVAVRARASLNFDMLAHSGHPTMGGGAETDERIKAMGPEILESSVPGPKGQNGGAPRLEDTGVQGSSRRAESA
jgi:hypothetical protein